ncbi:MAG: hypothetical protein Kow009_13890 [Spirochaetales bacterium]
MEGERKKSYRVGVHSKMEVMHFLVGDFGEETVPHSHDYLVEWVCTASSLDENGFSVNIAVMEEILAREVEFLKGRILNDLPYFRTKQTSVENFAEYLLSTLMNRLKESEGTETIRSAEVIVRESSTAWASCQIEG